MTTQGVVRDRVLAMLDAVWCPQCGPDVVVDEDGCCASCGADAMGDGADMAARLRADLATARAALAKINTIRNSIVGLQAINWSEHIYPLVAALDEAGIEGMGYGEARPYFGSMLDRTIKAESDLTAARAEAETLRGDPRMRVPLDGPGSHRCDLAEMRAQATRAEAALSCLRELVEALPKCAYGHGGSQSTGARCQRPAAHWITNTQGYCDEHSGGPGRDYKYAAPLRRALALVGGGAS